MTCQQYYETFKNNVEVIEYCGGTLGKDTGLVNAELTTAGLTRATAGPGQLRDAEDAAKERVLVACALLYGSNRVRYGKLLEDLENDYTQGANKYPSTLQQAYALLLHWKQDPRNVVRLMEGVNDGGSHLPTSGRKLHRAAAKARAPVRNPRSRATDAKEKGMLPMTAQLYLRTTMSMT
jgi:hypothetical protein